MGSILEFYIEVSKKTMEEEVEISEEFQWIVAIRKEEMDLSSLQVMYQSPTIQDIDSIDTDIWDIVEDTALDSKPTQEKPKATYPLITEKRCRNNLLIELYKLESFLVVCQQQSVIE